MKICYLPPPQGREAEGKFLQLFKDDSGRIIEARTLTFFEIMRADCAIQAAALHAFQDHERRSVYPNGVESSGAVSAMQHLAMPSGEVGQ